MGYITNSLALVGDSYHMLSDVISLLVGFASVRVSLSVKIQYCQTFNIRCTLVGNKFVDHSDVVGASPVGAAPTTSSFLI